MVRGRLGQAGRNRMVDRPMILRRRQLQFVLWRTVRLRHRPMLRRWRRLLRHGSLPHRRVVRGGRRNRSVSLRHRTRQHPRQRHFVSLRLDCGAGCHFGGICGGRLRRRHLGAGGRCCRCCGSRLLLSGDRWWRCRRLNAVRHWAAREEWSALRLSQLNRQHGDEQRSQPSLHTFGPR